MDKPGKGHSRALSLVFGGGSEGGQPSDFGLRRRHSAPQDAEALERIIEHSPSSAVDGGPAQRSVTDPLLPSSPADDEEDDPRPSQPKGVRFSSEIDRIPWDGDNESVERLAIPAQHISRSPSPVSPVGPLPPSQRLGTPNLSINTGQAERLQSSSLSRSANPRSPQSPQSPQSPTNRNRGYSLRRSIFNRNIHTQPEPSSAGSIIELQDVSLADSPGSAQVGPSAGPTKKSVEPTISAIAREEEELPPWSKQESKQDDKKWHGISALPHYEKWVKKKSARRVVPPQLKQWYNKTRKFVLRINEIPPSKDGRHVQMDAFRKKGLTDERTNKPYIGNIIRSSRYNAWNFLPKQLWAQFSKLANAYFLCVSILQMIPGLSTTGTYTTIIPLLFFVSISIAKEGYDDWRRSKLDKEENNRLAHVLHAYQPVGSDDALDNNRAASFGPKHWSTAKWKDVKVGDIVKLDRDQAAPSDLILLHSSGENGIAYIETMALDGETNLKSKQAAPLLAENCSDVDKLAAAKAEIVVEDPNRDLYNFEGKVTLNGETQPLTNNEVVYRGSILRNTPHAIGLIIYTGEECKIRMNANTNPRVKAPSLQSLVNKIVVVIVFFVLFLAVFNTVAYQIWSENVEDDSWYLTKAGVSFGPILVSFIIMFNTMIPLSLYVSQEIIKVVQMLLLNDLDMYDEDSNTPLEARTSTINEELGQISYIFSDKTGTLTDNMMKFRKISVAGTAWLHDPDLKAEAIEAVRRRSTVQRQKSKGKKKKSFSWRLSESDDRQRRSNVSAFTKDHPANRDPSPVPDEIMSPGWKSSARPAKSQPELPTLEMIRYIQRRPYTVFARKARFFLLSIALCHTCLPEAADDGTIQFQAASPDELALVQAAQELGFMVVDRRSGILTMKTFPNGLYEDPHFDRYEVLDVIEFSSKRKRMSVVVRLPDRRICVITKGADSIVTKLLRMSSLAMDKNSDIERRASKRKSLEAQQVIARRRESHDATPTSARISFSFGIPRTSTGGLGKRPSVSGSRKPAIQKQVANWLSERENEVDASGIDDDTQAYSPRPSGNYGRPSAAYSERSSKRSSFVDEDDGIELVEEALVVDEPTVVERTFQHINDFATEGLRTLLYGYRFLQEDEYKQWKKLYQDATTSLVDRQELIERAGDMIEQGLELGGATAIEDKLQKGVPETIDKLRRANIRMWMLTGDKRETAINIGHSCRLIKDYSTVTVLDHETGSVEQSIASAILAIGSGDIAHSVVVVDGQTLAMIEADGPLYSLFFDLTIATDSVICCRASPSQKASLVKSIRRKLNNKITLAIGDGANDIAMIQEAHVGIGITGKEGLQAARTSDYSIAQFRFLQKLLLVHGRWNYNRICKYTLATFWKETMFYLTQAFYQRWAGYTGTSLYESWSLSMFNTLFTSLPVIILGIFEKDLQPSTLLAVPELYASLGQKNAGFNFKLYLWWIFLATAEAVTIFFCGLGLFGQPEADWGFYNDAFPLGDLCFSAVIMLVSTKLQWIEMHNISIANCIASFLSVGGWWLWNILLSAIYGQNNEYDVKDGFLTRFGRDWQWWLSLLIMFAAVLILELGAKSLFAVFLPTDADIFQALEKDPQMKARFKKAAGEGDETAVPTGENAVLGQSGRVWHRRLGSAGVSKVFRLSGEWREQNKRWRPRGLSRLRSRNEDGRDDAIQEEEYEEEYEGQPYRPPTKEEQQRREAEVAELLRQRIMINEAEVAASTSTLGQQQFYTNSNEGESHQGSDGPAPQRSKSVGELFKGRFGSVVGR